MTVSYRIDPNVSYKGINITLDLGVFAIAPEDIHNALSVPEEHLKHARISRLPERIEGAVTSLYYPFGCIRVRDHIVTSPNGISQRQIPWWSVPQSEEDSAHTLKKYQTSLTDLASVSPSLQVVTLTTRRRWDEHPSGTEIIQLHIAQKIQRRILQFKAEANCAYTLMRRLDRIRGYSNSTIQMGNIRLRDILSK